MIDYTIKQIKIILVGIITLIIGFSLVFCLIFGVYWLFLKVPIISGTLLALVFAYKLGQFILEP